MPFLTIFAMFAKQSPGSLVEMKRSPWAVFLFLASTASLFAADVTPQVQRLGNPSLTRYPGTNAYPRTVWDLKLWQNKIYIGSGDSAANAGPVNVWAYDLGTKQFNSEALLSQEQIATFPVCGTTLCIPNHDPGGGGLSGEWYRLDPGGWRAFNTMMNFGISVIHNYDMMQYGSLLVAGLGSERGLDVVLSPDNGQTWTRVNQGYPNSGGLNCWGSRVYTVFQQGSDLYATTVVPTDLLQPANGCGVHEYTNGQFPHRSDLRFGTLFPGINQATLDSLGKHYALLRSEVIYNGRVVYIGGTEFDDHSIMPFGAYHAKFDQSPPSVQAIPLPAGALPFDLLVANNALYLLIGTHTGSSTWAGGSWRMAVYTTTDLQNWSELFYWNTGTAGFARSLELDGNGNFYFGMGCGMPVGSLLYTRYQDRPATNTFSNDSGDILMVPKSAYSGAPGNPPIVSGGSATGQVGLPFSYQISATQNPTSYNATGLPSGLSVNTSNGQISGTPTTATSGAVSVTLQATNAFGTDTATLLLTIQPAPGNPPNITSPATATGQVGTAFNYQITATNSPTSFNASPLPAGLSINTSNGRITGTPTTATSGPLSVTLRATNAFGTDTATLALTIQGNPPNITSPATASGQVGTAFSYQITATNSPSSFAATGLPAGLSINTVSGLISGTPSVSGSFSVMLQATNPHGSDSQTLSLTIQPAGAAPVITSALSATGQVTIAFSYQITATNSPTSYSVTGLPAGLSLNTTTGLISGTPNATGSFSVTLRATNIHGTGTATLALTIQSAPGNPPVIGGTLTATGQVGTAFSYHISATNSPTSYTASPLPAGLSMNGTSGLISGTPTAATSGALSVNLSATNAFGSDTAILSLTIQPVPGNPPAITSALNASGQVGVAFSYQITATNSPTSYSATGLPAGLSINTANGLISGTPTSATVGSISVTLRATNAHGTGTATLALSIAAAAGNPPVITSALTASGQAGSVFTYQITATNSPTSFTAAPLPGGLTLNTATGRITGTPMAPTTGAVSVTLRAKNANGTGSAVLALTILPAPGNPPVINSPATANGQMGVPFSYQITATNSPSSFDATLLPSGIYLNTTTGLITGTPNFLTVGTHMVQISATNMSGTTTRTIQFTLAPVNLPTPTLTIPSQMPVNSVIQVTYPPGYAVARFQWTFTPDAGPSSSGLAGAPAARAPVSHFTLTPVAQLASLALLPGGYTVSVTAMDPWNNVSGSASAITTLVAAQLGTARLFPNPWRQDRHATNRITFTDLTTDTRIQIFTVSGHQVRDLGRHNGTVNWDLKNESGDTVGSGIYLFLLTNSDGQTQRGKLAIIR